jgi:hypothetical protein
VIAAFFLFILILLIACAVVFAVVLDIVVNSGITIVTQLTKEQLHGK